MSEQKNIVKEIDEQVDGIIAHATKKYPDRLFMFEFQKAFWGAINNAHRDGKKLILLGPNFPTEIVYALDAVPFVLDTIPTRAASQKGVAEKYIDLAEKYVPATLCGIDKIDVGIMLSGDISDKPDAMFYTVTPCDSSRVAYGAFDQHLGVPSFCVDTPYRKDARGIRYIAEQLKDAVAKLEEITGNKLDWNKMAEVIKRSNEACVLLGKIADLRKNVPCPLPGRFLVLNEMFSSMMGSQAIIDFLAAEYEMGKKALENKEAATGGEEKFRFIWLQNMLWSNVGIMDWMEKEYGAIVVMDAFGYQGGLVIENPDDQEAVFNGLARRVLAVPMIHGASGPIDPWMELTENVVRDYKVDASMFVGHVGCKHTWAAGKLIKDMVQDKFGIPTLTFDVDSIDSRYKSTEEIKAIITDYMDTLKENRQVQ